MNAGANYEDGKDQGEQAVEPFRHTKGDTKHRVGCTNPVIQGRDPGNSCPSMSDT